MHILPTAPGEEVCKDKQSQADKEKVMRKQRINSFFYSMADTFKYMAGILTTVGMAVSLPSFAGAVSGGFGAALAAVPTFGIAIIAAAAVTTLVAVSSQMIASRYFHGANYDSLELNARHTAKYLAKELEHDGVCKRADGKTWQQHMQSRAAENQQGQSL